MQDVINSEISSNEVSDDVLKDTLNAYNEEAERIIDDEDTFERFIQRLEMKMKLMPLVGKYASDITCMVSLVRSYVRKEYKDIPIGTIISITASLAYIVSPIDLIPDGIPVAGQIDDIAMVLFILKFVHSDVEEYRKWRKENGKEIIDFEESI